MGICYDLVSDYKKESFDLGKSYPVTWGELFNNRNEFDDKIKTEYDLAMYMFNNNLDKENADSIYIITNLAKKIWTFISTHHDWRLVDDAKDDYSTFDSVEEMENDYTIDEWNPVTGQHQWRKYVEVGSRYIKE